MRRPNRNDRPGAFETQGQRMVREGKLTEQEYHHILREKEKERSWSRSSSGGGSSNEKSEPKSSGFGGGGGGGAGLPGIWGLIYLLVMLPVWAVKLTIWTVKTLYKFAVWTIRQGNYTGRFQRRRFWISTSIFTDL